MSYCIIGTHTGIGKTVFSSVLCKASGFDYWKPVQAGDLDDSDTINVQRRVADPSITLYPERFRLTHAVSPHRAAELDGLDMQLSDFVLPKSEKLVVETAGGLMSPINQGILVLDLAKNLNLPLVLVSGNYLGSINHTLLTVAAIKNAKLNLKGIVFSGEPNESTESFILNHAEVPCLFHLRKMDKVDAHEVEKQAKRLSQENPFWI